VVLQELAAYTQEGFTQLKDTIREDAEKTNTLYKYLIQLGDGTNQQFLDTNTALQGQAQLIQEVIVTVWQIYQDLGRKRQLIQLYWDYDHAEVFPALGKKEFQPLCHDTNPETHYCDDTIQKAVKFIGKAKGNPPMTLAERDATKNVAGALLMARVGVQFTQLRDQQQMRAYSYSIEYLCDQAFMLDNNLPSVSLKTLFSRLGPAGCNDGAIWRCQCVIKWQENSCDIQPNVGLKSWPWEFPAGATPPLLIQEGNKNSVCGNGQFHLGPVRIITSQATFVTSMRDAFCQRPGGLKFVYRTPPKDKPLEKIAIRLVAQEITTQWNLADPSGNPTSCMSNFTSADADDNYLSSFIYRSWQQTYQVFSRTNLPAADAKYYGVMPTHGLQFDDIPIARDPQTNAAINCMEARYTSIGLDKVKLYQLELTTQLSGVKLVVRGRPGEPIEPTIGYNNFTWFDSPTEQLTTNIVAAIEQESAAPASINRFGAFDPYRIKYVYDTTPDLIGVANTAPARCGKLNYIFKHVNWTGSSIDIDQWEEQYRERYDPTCATESLLWYRRMIVEETLECGASFATGAPNPQNYEWCKLMRAFKCHLDKREDPRTKKPIEVVVCQPRKWSYTATLVIPAGQLQAVVSAQCPDVSVKIINSNVFAVLTSSAPVANLVQVTVTDEKGKIDTCYPCCRKNQEYTLPSRVAYPIDVGKCPGKKLRLSITTMLDPSKPCFDPPIDMTSVADYSGEVLPPIAPLVDEHIRIFKDDIANELAKQIEWLTDFQYELKRISDESKNRDEIKKKVYDIIRNRTIEINKIIVRNITDKAAEIDKKIKEDTDKITDNIERGKNASKELDRLLKELKELNKQGRDIQGQINKTVQQIIKDNKETQKAIEEWRKAQQGKCDLGIPIIGPLFCIAGNLLQSIFGGNGNTWGIVISILIILICIGCCVYLCVTQSRNSPAPSAPSMSSYELRNIAAGLEGLKQAQLETDKKLVDAYAAKLAPPPGTVRAGEQQPLVNPAATKDRLTRRTYPTNRFDDNL
jgi:hypothetical protein